MPSCSDYLPAKMKHRLTLQSVSRVTDSQGGYTEEWDDEATLWASIAPLKGYERFQAHQMQTPVTHKIIIRYRSDVTTKHRFLYGERILQIKQCLNKDEANNFLEILALEN